MQTDRHTNEYDVSCRLCDRFMHKRIIKNRNPTLSVRTTLLNVQVTMLTVYFFISNYFSTKFRGYTCMMMVNGKRENWATFRDRSEIVLVRPTAHR